jgi:aspartate ammonia-lyase
MRVATLDLVRELLPALDELAGALEAKAAEFDDVLKSGRTHMQDAVPIRLGQEFAAWALTLRRARARIADASESMKEQNIGATAVGTASTPSRATSSSSSGTSEQTGHELRTAQSLVQATQSMRPMVEVSAALRARRRPHQALGGPAPHLVGAAHGSRRSSCRPSSRGRRSCPAR